MSKLVSDNLYVRNLHPFNNPLTSGHPILDPMYSKLISDGISNSVKDLIEIPTFSQMEATITKKKMEEQKLKKFALDNNEVFKEKSLEELTYNHFKELDDNRKQDQETKHRYFGLSPDEMEKVKEKQRDELLNKLATQPLTNSELRSISQWAASLPFSTNKMTFQEAMALDDARRQPVIVSGGAGSGDGSGDGSGGGEAKTPEGDVKNKYGITVAITSKEFIEFMGIRALLQARFGYVDVDRHKYEFYKTKSDYDEAKAGIEMNSSTKTGDAELLKVYADLYALIKTKKIFRGAVSANMIIENIINKRL